VCCVFYGRGLHTQLPTLPTRRSSDLPLGKAIAVRRPLCEPLTCPVPPRYLSRGQSVLTRSLKGCDIGRRYGSEGRVRDGSLSNRSEEHTSELQSRENLVCRLLREKKK